MSTKKLLAENITKDYKKCQDDQVYTVNKEAAIIASKLGIDDKVEQFTTKEAFLSLKDHKSSFPRKVECRLINPAKSSIGRIAKHILEDMNNEIRMKLSLLQWKSTSQCLEWFKGINNNSKQKLSFVKFDIESFYPSITK